jgi:hypothetical protein
MTWLRLAVLWAVSLFAVPSAWAGRCPNVGIILDRSGSMAQATDGSAPTPTNPAKWEIATKAVSDLVNQHDGKFPLGLVYFPSTSVTGVCATSASFDIPIGYGNKGTILSSLTTVKPSGNTPTGDAINNAINEPSFLDAARKQFVILITDGKPCCMPGCTDASVLAFDAVSAVQRGRGRQVEIKTFVVGFGRLAPDELQVMNDMADAGGVPAATSGMYHYYRAEDSTALSAALDGIIKTVVLAAAMSAAAPPSAMTAAIRFPAAAARSASALSAKRTRVPACRAQPAATATPVAPQRGSASARAATPVRAVSAVCAAAAKPRRVRTRVPRVRSARAAAAGPIQRAWARAARPVKAASPALVSMTRVPT